MSESESESQEDTFYLHPSGIDDEEAYLERERESEGVRESNYQSIAFLVWRTEAEFHSNNSNKSWQGFEAMFRTKVLIISTADMQENM